ncbi:MAG: CGNR zinc finger domain-containing protein [Candidatus Limnocylindria bacterium]
MKKISDPGTQPVGQGSQPAPGRLEAVRAFINTADLEDGTDEIGSPASLAAWLTRNGLMIRGRRVTAQDHGMALELREALRDLLDGNAGRPVPTDATVRLDRIAASVPLRLSFAGGIHIEPEPGGGGPALGRLLAAVHEAAADGSWERLKVCGNDECRWAFYDTSRNRSGAWCTMAICGNRMKGRAFRRRLRAEA